MQSSSVIMKEIMKLKEISKYISPLLSVCLNPSCLMGEKAERRKIEGLTNLGYNTYTNGNVTMNYHIQLS
jgi:hypothetical protein